MDDEVSVQAWGPTRCCELWNWPRDTEGVNRTSGLTGPAPDSAPCHNTEQSGGGTQSQSVGRGGWLHTQEGSQLVGTPGPGRDLVLATILYPRRQIIRKCPVGFPGPGGPMNSEAPEEYFKGDVLRAFAGLSAPLTISSEGP